MLGPLRTSPVRCWSSPRAVRHATPRRTPARRPRARARTACVRRTIRRSGETSPVGIDRRLNELGIRLPRFGCSLASASSACALTSAASCLHVLESRVLLRPCEPAGVPLDAGVAAPGRDLVGDELERPAAFCDALRVVDRDGRHEQRERLLERSKARCGRRRRRRRWRETPRPGAVREHAAGGDERDAAQEEDDDEPSRRDAVGDGGQGDVVGPPGRCERVPLGRRRCSRRAGCGARARATAPRSRGARSCHRRAAGRRTRAGLNS